MFKPFELENIFNRFGMLLEKHNISKNMLKQSMLLIGDGELEYKEYNEMYKYIEHLPNNKLLIVYGSIGYPILTYGYSYEIKICENKVNKTHFGGGFGASGFIVKDMPTLFSYSTYQTVYFNETIISEVCKIIRNKINI